MDTDFSLSWQLEQCCKEHGGANIFSILFAFLWMYVWKWDWVILLLMFWCFIVTALIYIPSLLDFLVSLRFCTSGKWLSHFTLFLALMKDSHQFPNSWFNNSSTRKGCHWPGMGLMPSLNQSLMYKRKAVLLLASEGGWNQSPSNFWECERRLLRSGIWNGGSYSIGFIGGYIRRRGWGSGKLIKKNVVSGEEQVQHDPTHWDQEPTFYSPALVVHWLKPSSGGGRPLYWIEDSSLENEAAVHCCQPTHRAARDGHM